MRRSFLVDHSDIEVLALSSCGHFHDEDDGAMDGCSIGGHSNRNKNEKKGKENESDLTD